MNSPNAKPLRKRRPSPLSVVALPALLLLTLDPRAALAGSPKSSKSKQRSSGAAAIEAKPKAKPEPKLELRKTVNQIDGLTVEELDDGTTILRLLGSVEPTFNVYRLSDPDRLVVDVSKSERGKAVPHVPVDSWAVGRVTISSIDEHGGQLARVVVNLKRESSYIVVPSGRDLIVTITPKEVAPEAYFARKSAGKRQAEIESMKAKAEKQAAELEAAAVELEAEAKARAASAERKASSAEERATSAEERATSAEQRAREAAAKAREAEKKAAAIREEAEAVKAKAEAEAKKLAKAAEAEAKKLAEAAEAEAKKLAKAAEAEAQELAEAAEAKARKLAEEAAAKAKQLEQLAEARAKKREHEAAARAKQLSKVAELEAKKLTKTSQAEARKLTKEAEAKAKQREKEAEAKAERLEKEAEQLAAATLTKAERLEAEAAAKAERLEKEAEQLAAATLTKAERLEAEAAAKAKQRELEAERLADATAAKAKKREQTARTKAKQLERGAVARAKRLERGAELEAEQLAAAARTKAEQLEAEAAAKAKQLEDRAAAKAKQLERGAVAKAKQLEDSAASKAKQVEQGAVAKAKQLEDSAASKAKQLEQGAVAKAKQLEDSAASKAEQTEKLASAAAGKLSEAERLTAEYETKLERAEQRASEAERKATHAEQRAAEAKAEAEAAEVYATRIRAGAEAKAKRAEALLTKAAAAMAEAEDESELAKQAHDEAKLALADARKAARKQGKRDTQKRRELERAVERAEAEAEAAKQREDQANARFAELERDRDALAEALAAKQAEASALETELDSTRSALADAQDSVRDAKSRYEALGGAEGPSAGDKRAHRKARAQLAKAESELAKLGAAAEAERKQLEELRTQVATTSEQLGETLASDQKRRSLGQQWNDEREAAGVATIRDIRFEDGPSEARVVVELDGPVVYDASSLTPNMTMLELRGTKIPVALERSLDTTSFAGPIDRITSFREGADVKIVVASTTADPVALELDRKTNRLIWKFPKRAEDDQGQLARAPEHELREGPPVRSEVVSLGGTKVSGFSTPPVLASRPGAQVGSRSRWRGERIDIELQDAPIKDVLLLFSDIGRVNIIAGPEVQGSVTMKLSAVPWDQALDIILRSLNLGMVQEGNVIRVATLAGLEDERRKAIEEANAQVQLKPLETRLVPLSYATVQDMLPKVQSVLSSRGSVTPDSRTNTLIVMDVAENIALAESLVRQLDSQTPQVLIEARIVEARTNWLRQLGIQWGFDYIASPGTGNPTGLLFPNSIGVAGGSGSNQSPVRGLILPGAAANPNYAVDLPAPVSTGTGGAIGFSFGSLSGNLNTNLRLSAAEDEGEVRIISAPKIVTLDNTEAQIEQGVQIPISQVSAQGVNTRYVNATLGLRVTPHVTNEGAVLLEVQVQKNEADFVNTGARGDPTILTKSAQSQLLITDGDTAVIGGIYTRNQAVNRNKVPWLGDIPIIGWFFKKKTERDDRSEMLIFLTPRIVNRSTSIGG